MGLVKSVEYIQITIPNTTTVVTENLSKGQDETQCVPFVSVRSTSSVSDGHTHRAVRAVFLDSGGTPQIRVDRGGSSGDLIVDVFVVEWESSITVQQVSVGMSHLSGSNTAAITSVTSLANAFCLYSYMFSSTLSDDWDEEAVSHEFSSTTQLAIARNNTVGQVNGMAYVVECSSGEFTVQHISVSTGTGDNDTITGVISSAVVLADSFLVHSYQTDENTSAMPEGLWIGDISSTVQVRSRRSISATVDKAAEHRFQVVECNNSEWDVQRNDAWTLTATSQTDSITSISQSRSVIQQMHCGTSIGRNDSSTGTDVDDVMSSLDFPTDSLVRAQRRANTIDTVIGYEVIQFAAEGGGSLVNRPMVNTLVNGGLVS